jgi:hypothetical protein
MADAVLTVEVTEGLRPLQILTTTCCGARMWAHIAMDICPTCDRPIDRIIPAKERDLSHLRHHTTRYWS